MRLVVEEEVLALVAADGADEIAREDTAPGDLARVDGLVRRRLLGQSEELTARDRADAIGADDDVGLDGGAIGEAELVPVGSARDVDELLAGVQLSRVERIAEDVEKLGARDLRRQRARRRRRTL